MFRISLVFACLALSAASAHATGGFSCLIDDANLKFTADSTVSHGLGEGFVNFTAEAELKAVGAPQTLRKIDLSEALVHSWLYGPDLKLRLYRETDGNVPHGFVEIIMETAAQGEAGEPEFEGSYKLILYQIPEGEGGDGMQSEYRGQATCSVG
jgi:hypothetical protein